MEKQSELTALDEFLIAFPFLKGSDATFLAWRFHTPSATGLPVNLDFNTSAGV